MYNIIVNPVNNQYYGLNSKMGKTILKNYIQSLIAGAESTPTSAPLGPIRPGPSALMIAAQNGNAQEVTLLLANDRLDPNIADQDGNTPLIFAAGDGHASVVTLLLANERVDPNLANNSGWTALMWAADEGHASVVTLLLANDRVDPNMADQDGDTALIGAADNGHASVVTLLLAHERVDPNMANQDGYTALTSAAFKEDASMLKLLLAHHRVTRTRPTDGDGPQAQAAYDTALRNVKRQRNARFRGLTRAIMVFRRMRLRAAEAVYAPGGTGFVAAEASFEASRGGTQQQQQQQQEA
jgi:ankyrin repeat protein